MDVILDIRQDSPAYGEYVSLEVSAVNHRIVYIPRGCAHGFWSKEDGSCVIYLQTAAHDPDHDLGIRYDSFGYQWPERNPILSQRDNAFPHFKDFKTPFQFGKP
jgi:dTDP-4-dehydrorhamnose 3,5-epimerase-like enzyme